MSAVRTPRYRRLLPSLVGFALLLCLAVPADAQSRRKRNDDYLDQVARKNEVLVQKIEDEVTDALVKSRRLGPRDPAKAVRLLKETLAHVEDNTALTESRRTVLSRVLRQRVRSWEEKVDRTARDGGAREDVRERRRARRAEDDDARRGRFEDIRGIYRGRSDAIREAARGRSEGDRRARGTLGEVERSAMLPRGEVEFPRDWKARVAKRKPALLSKREKAILRILNSVISVDFKEQSFNSVIDYLRDKTGQPFLVDKQAMEEANIDYDTPISLKAKKVTVRTLLRKVLADVGLTYIIKDEMIQITSWKKAKASMVVRTYPVADIVTCLDPGVPPLLRPAQTVQNVKSLISLIKSSIDPDSWGNGEQGGGSISFHAGTMSLVVKQSAEVHYRLGNSLGR
jgi:hypothetical protein